MYSMWDSYERYNSPTNKVRCYNEEDLENLPQVLFAMRGRMLGYSWQELSVITKIEKSTLIDRCNSIFGDMIVKYDFKKADGLSKEYKEYFSIPYSDQIKDVMNDRKGGVILLNDELGCYEDEILIDEYLKDWHNRTGVSWQKACRMDFDDVMKLAQKGNYKKEFTKAKSYRPTTYDKHNIDWVELYSDFQENNNDHSTPGHGKSRFTYGRMK